MDYESRLDVCDMESEGFSIPSLFSGKCSVVVPHVQPLQETEDLCRLRRELFWRPAGKYGKQLRRLVLQFIRPVLLENDDNCNKTS